MLNMRRVALITGAVLAVTPVAVAGPCWNELADGGGDAGRLPASAQRVAGYGPLTCISGDLSIAQIALGSDYEDMYLIRITDPENFFAETIGPGMASFDTQLWLFDATGLGLLGNDDLSVVELKSRIALPTTDGTNPIILANRLYLLAITGKNNDPISATGAIFNQASATEVSGPDGPGAANVVSTWNPGTGAVGTYLIQIGGACHVDSCVPTLSGWGVAAMMLSLGVAGTIVLRRRFSAKFAS